ncbi:MAG: crossover junction endodeoxyribonuclease RuvC [Candidatus Melainabacteria bacterium GWF2_32_7]|nr:MAG: crossover junction endodeoxyribonuclease RuvC [Candidatus Melainabacteria bacterium GWF2_32_7]
MRIIGIDPGMAIVGYCFMDSFPEKVDNQNILVNCGSIQTSKNLNNSERLLEIHNDLSQLLKTYKPDVASVEQIFYFKNAKTIMPVSEARGVIVMTLEMFGIPICEYTPLVVKQTITGYGRAEKKDVKEMVKVLLGDEQKIPKLDDTVDAIAIAICHTMCIH